MTTIYQAPYNLTHEQVSAPDTPTFLLPICTTPERLAKMLGALIEGGMVLGYGQIDDYNIDFFEALAKLTTCDDTTTPVEIPEIVNQVIQCFIAGDDCNDRDNDCEECENMACAKPVKIGGNWYLQMDCGCDESQFFALQPVTLDSNGDPVPFAEGGSFGGGFSNGNGGASGSWQQNGVSDVSCYAAQAVPYMLNRAIEFSGWVIDAESLGVDWLLQQVDEWIETAEFIADWIEGVEDLDDIADLAKDVVAAALTNSAVVDPLLAAWTFTGVPTKSQLASWVNKAPFMVGDVPVRLVLLQWVAYSFMVGYRTDLIQLAASCESGNAIPSYTFPTVEYLLNEQGYDWAHVYDLREVELVENAYFDIQYGVFEPGVGFIEEQNVYTAPHSNARCRWDMISVVGGGTLDYFAVDYKFEPNPEIPVSGSTSHNILGTNYPFEPWDGMREYFDLNTGGNIGFDADCDRVLNSETTSGDYHTTVRRVALAGYDTDIFGGLETV